RHSYSAFNAQPTPTAILPYSLALHTFLFLFLLTRPPPTPTLFPYTTLFRSPSRVRAAGRSRRRSVPSGNTSNGSSRALPKGKLRSEEHTSELQSRENLVCRLLLEKKKKKKETKQIIKKQRQPTIR